MAFHLIITCVSQKRARKVHSILDSNINTGSLDYVFSQWRETLLKSKFKKKKAIELYKGSLWNSFLDAWGVVNNREKDAHLWILSAGYGLISAEEKIVPYDITFQEPRNGAPSIQMKVTGFNGTNSRRNLLQGWWDHLTKSTILKPASLTSLMKESNKDDYFLVVLGKDYLEAIFKDLQKGIKASKNPKNIAVISNNVGDPLAKRLKSNWLYADSRFVNLPRSNNTVVNAKIVKEILWHMFHEQKGISWWSHNNFNSHLKQISLKLPEPIKHDRNASTDEQVKEYIRKALGKKDKPFSRLHRAYRDSGWACEYNRFKGLYNKVKEDLKKQVLSTRPDLPVIYKKRKTKMLFFLPDWDDRVDPLYDFVKDEPTPNRNPYSHDAYHYELYGHLNCDGILVSKSVLEENAQKKERVKEVGIHKYLRLPPNAPVLGDCGAFNYIAQKNPPYETDEILEYYETLGFDYGVSLDHLIVPGILKRKRQFKLESGKWFEISETGFKELKQLPETVVKKKRSKNNQRGLFQEKIILVEETYIDENEKLRRYNLTINNAKKFIEGHRKRKCTFTPIGGVQGWDPESYANAVSEYQKMGYQYIALGGLVKSTTPEIIDVLEQVSKVRKASTKLHLFGVARIDAIEDFIKLGVHSVDSAGMLRQAWLSSSSNYYSPDMYHFSAIRIPPADKGKAAKKVIETGKIEKDKLLAMERECLSLLRNYDKGQVDIIEVLEKVMAYNKIMGGNENLYAKYVRTLSEKPWKKCRCKLCKDTGIDIIIFRRNNRNRRRGFHNTWLFFNKFKYFTDTD